MKKLSGKKKVAQPVDEEIEDQNFQLGDKVTAKYIDDDGIEDWLPGVIEKIEHNFIFVIFMGYEEYESEKVHENDVKSSFNKASVQNLIMLEDEPVKEEQLESQSERRSHPEEALHNIQRAESIPSEKHIIGTVYSIPTNDDPGLIEFKYRDDSKIRYFLGSDQIQSGTIVRFSVIPDSTWIRIAVNVESTIEPVTYPPARFARNCSRIVAYPSGKVVTTVPPHHVADYLTPHGKTLHDANMMIQTTKINADENRENEFKLFTGRNLITKITESANKYLNAFLNSEGGCIYFGIHDETIVYGEPLQYKIRDKIRQEVDVYLQHMKPTVDTNLYSIKFIPVLTKEGYLIKDLYVIKCTAKKGDAAFYTTDDGKVWIRRDGSTMQMKQELMSERLRQANVMLGGINDGFQLDVVDKKKNQRDVKQDIIENLTNMGLSRPLILDAMYILETQGNEYPNESQVVDIYYKKNPEDN